MNDKANQTFYTPLGGSAGTQPMQSATLSDKDYGMPLLDYFVGQDLTGLYSIDDGDLLRVYVLVTTN